MSEDKHPNCDAPAGFTRDSASTTKMGESPKTFLIPLPRRIILEKIMHP